MKSKHVKVSQNLTRMIIASARDFFFGGWGAGVAIYIHPGLEHTTSPSTMLLQEEDVPFELEFIGTSAIKNKK